MEPFTPPWNASSRPRPTILRLGACQKHWVWVPVLSAGRPNGTFVTLPAGVSQMEELGENSLRFLFLPNHWSLICKFPFHLMHCLKKL